MTFRGIVFGIAAATALSLAAAALAQSDHGHDELPSICKSADAQNMMSGGDMGSMSEMMGSMDQAHQDLMKSMEVMHGMMQGMQAADIDVAFVCSMIPHHQGAIEMAKAELAHGDDPWAKELAQRVIDAQEQEITEMLDWLAKQSN